MECETEKKRNIIVGAKLGTAFQMTSVKALTRCELVKLDEEGIFLLKLTLADNRFHPTLMRELLEVFDYIES